MSIPEIILKIKLFLTDPDREHWIGWGIIILISLGSFGFGLGGGLLLSLAKPSKLASDGPLVVFAPLAPQAIVDTSMSLGTSSYKTSQGSNTPTTPQTGSTGSFLASKSGKVYYPSTCKSSNRIKEENRIYFKSAQEAEHLGYTLSKLCD